MCLATLAQTPERCSKAYADEPRVSEGSPTISVILVPDSFRAAFPAGLEPFLRQTADAGAFELVLVDWEGGPSYRALAERFWSQPGAPRLVYLRSPERSRAAMNNLGVSRATAPLIAFCADDFVPGPSYVAAHLAYHAAHPERVRVAIGPGHAPPRLRADSPFLAWLEDSGELFGARFREPSRALPAAYFYVANVSLKRSFCVEVGPFDERFPFPAYDDLDYGQRLARLGMVSELVPMAVCIHEHPITLAERRIHAGWAGTSAAILASREVRRAERGRHLARVQALAHWQSCATALRDGPQIAWWRLMLSSSFSSAYRRQMLTALG
jgi:hypothetical protein